MIINKNNVSWKTFTPLGLLFSQKSLLTIEVDNDYNEECNNEAKNKDEK